MWKHLEGFKITSVQESNLEILQSKYDNFDKGTIRFIDLILRGKNPQYNNNNNDDNKPPQSR